ncbi:MAG: glycosyltransferase family 2 protein [Xanthomonadaceae bacterium]|jgi:glycosyltransferase involved in cell wall biosynthesis|nr:glycosyltransferase family 2 protein [Xanthomonadaceae bacterium]
MDSSKPSAISLIVLTYNWKDALRRVLDSVASQHRLPAEVIAADDGSREDTRQMLEGVARDFPMPLRHVWQSDTGFRAARCRNLGIAASRGDYIVLIDGDMVLHPDFIADHAMLARPGTFLQGGRLKSSMRETQRLLAGGKPVFSPWTDADFKAFDATRRLYAFRQPALARWKARKPGGRVMSCNMSFWRNDLLKVNGFDERMEGYGAEDRELAARLENAGIRKHPLKWAALACHLEHSSRAQENVDDIDLPNNRILAETRESGVAYCEKGIDKLGAVDVVELNPDIAYRPQN